MSVVLAVACSSAQAVLPPAEPRDGVQVAHERVQIWHPEVQARYLAAEPWQTFRAGDGAGWRAVFDEHTGTPRTLWGGGITMPTRTEGDLVRAVGSWLDRHHALLGFASGTLRPAGARYNSTLDAWYVDFDVMRDDVPTWRGGIQARVQHGNLVVLHVATAPRATVTGGFELSEQAAMRAAIDGGPVPQASHTERTADRWLLDRKTVAGHELRKVWLVRSETEQPWGRWATFVDGQTGELLAVHDEVMYANGIVRGRHHPRTVSDALVDSAMPNLTVDGDTDSDLTGSDGGYTVTDSTTYVTDLNGRYLNVVNLDGDDGALSSSSPNMTWTLASATQAEIDVYVAADAVRSWAADVAPDVGIVTAKLRANVNGTAMQCNASYGGDVMNFFMAGGGCNNSAEIADIVYHEWGHGFHIYSYGTPWIDRSLGEGVADTVAFLQTGDERIGPDFWKGGSPVRNVDNERRYPDNFVAGDDRFYHANGLIFGGAMWDLRDRLITLEGSEVGSQSTEQIFAGLIKGAPDIPGTWAEALLADDDDGDLTNGTPHICAMYEAFGAHGLGPWKGGPVVLLSHEPLVDVPSGQDHTVDFELIPLAKECTSAGIASSTVHYRVQGGDWQSAFGDAKGLAASAAIPEQPLGSLVEYYIEGSTLEGSDFSIPANGVIQPYTFLAGETLDIRCMDFEDSDGNFDSDLLSGDTDDWEWGTPLGEGNDPSAAASGTRVWGNNLGGRSASGAYAPLKHNSLESRRWRTRHYTDVHLRYQRWLTVEDGSWDHAEIYVNDSLVWTNWAGENGGDEHHIDQTWVSHVVGLGGTADQGTAMMRWELDSDEGLQLGGWNIDDVCLVAPATPNNRLGINDFEAEAVDDIVARLSWTNPAHAPVEQIRVVRRFDRFPEGVDDGDVVYESDAPALGEAVVAEDLNFVAGESFYAAYAFDGTDWLSFTVEGLNADAADLEGGEAPPGWPQDLDGDGRLDPVVPASGGAACGCASGAAGGSAAWFAVLLLFLVRRRP